MHNFLIPAINVDDLNEPQIQQYACDGLLLYHSPSVPFQSCPPLLTHLPPPGLPPSRILVSITVTELILNYLFALFPEISYKEQTLLSQPINKGTSALLPTLPTPSPQNRFISSAWAT